MTTVHEYPEFVASRAKQLPSFEERIDHALLGVITECGELADAWKRHTIYERPLDTVNVREELGDLRFYLQMFLNEKDVEMGPEVRADIEMAREAGERGIEFTSLVSEILTNAIEATSLIRVAGHGSPSPGRSKRTTSASVNMTTALKCFADLCAFFHFEPNDIIAENIAKLEKRYPTGYSNAHAVARLDKIKGA